MPSILVRPSPLPTDAPIPLTFDGAARASVEELAARMAAHFRWVDPQWLWLELRRATGPGVLVVDCRNLEDYTRSRIRGSVHLSLPSLLLRRLAAGKLPVENAIPCGVARDTFLSACDAGRLLVVCGKPCAEPGNEHDNDDDELLGAVASVLLKRLQQDGHEAVVLGGSVDGFREEYPEWCETVGGPGSDGDASAGGGGVGIGPNNRGWMCEAEPAVVGLQALRLTPGYVQTPDSGYPMSKKSRYSSSSSSTTAGASRVRGAASSSNKSKKAPATLKPPRRFGVGSVDSLPDTTEEEDCGEDYGDDDAAADDLDGCALDSSLGSADSGSESGTLSTGGGYTDGPRAAKGFPVQILPYLYLGNAQNAEDEDALRQHSIQYILNVTPDLPNVFERRDSSGSGSESAGDRSVGDDEDVASAAGGDGNAQLKQQLLKAPSRGCNKGRRLNIKYKKIPIDDHWSQDLANFFPDAIQFIEEARTKGVGVLVHCLAGVSRSVTFTLAYLMFKLHLSLNDAFDFVRRRKGNIAPNFTFLGQLLEFERQQLPELRRKHQELLLATSAEISPPSVVSGDGGGGVPPSMVLPKVRVQAGSCSEDEMAAVVGAVADADAEAGSDGRATPGGGIGKRGGDDVSDGGSGGGGSGQCSSGGAPPFSATSPDSGIDFDR